MKNPQPKLPQSTDPEFQRLLQLDFKPKDESPVVIEHVRQAIRTNTTVTDEDIDQIRDEYTRNLMKRWNRMFS